MLYGNFTGYPSSNPLGIQGDSINLNAPLSSCPNGIKIHFSTISYNDSGGDLDDTCNIPDISIPNGRSSGSSNASSAYVNSSITTSIKGLALSFSVNDIKYNQINTGTVMYEYGGNIGEILAIASVTAY